MASDENRKKDHAQRDIISRIPNWGWLLISFLAAMLLWKWLSVNPTTARSFPFAPEVLASLGTVMGFVLGFVTSVPVAFLMAWYRPVRYIVEPWIQFIRNIPPLAYVPLVVISAGVGRRPQVIVIWLATFLIMTVTIYQGVRNVDETLIKAAKVLGAKDSDLFVKVIFPATTPFIITAVRLGVSVALTTLIAAESTGAIAGMGMRIRSLNNTFEVEPMLLYIIMIGIIGITSEKIIKYLERRFTGWQETRNV